MCIANQEIRRVDIDRSALLAEGLESPDDRPRERFFNSGPFIDVVALRAVIEVIFNQEDLRSGPLKLDHPGRAELATVEAFAREVVPEVASL